MLQSTAFNSPLQQLLLLEERVRRAGVTLPEDAGQLNRFHGIKCLINGQHCLLDIRVVTEIVEHRPITPIPGTRPWIEGVMNYRGALVPVFNLRRYFEQEPANVSTIQPGALIVCRHGGEKQALRVERVTGMQKFPLREFFTPEVDQQDPQWLADFADAGVEHGGIRWWLLDIQSLLANLVDQQPGLVAQHKEPHTAFLSQE